MKAKDYRQLLKMRGYKLEKVGPYEYSKYGGTTAFVKEHLYNRVVCFVDKDSHGKAQHFDFTITSQLMMLEDKQKKKDCELDYRYLLKEVSELCKACYALRDMKSPKHICI